MKDVGEMEDFGLTDAEQEACAQSNTFALNFFKQIAKEEKGNFFISPLSAEMAFAMLTNGADNQTHTQLKSALGYDNTSVDALNDYCSKMIYEMSGVDETTMVEIANSIWVDKGI